MKKLLLSIWLILLATIAYSQSQLAIPDTLSGSQFYLTIADSSHSFFTGTSTNTIGYNGSYLGPTLILNKGQNVTMHVHNSLSDSTTTHWHGIHVSPTNDGNPHSPIAPRTTWSPSFTVMDNAATYFYHPHMHGSTMKQVIKGAAGFIIVRDSAESNLALPRTYGVDDLPLAFQWQHMDSTTHQLIINDELDNLVMVNGVVVCPYVNVPAQVIRLRLLNASSHRFMEIGLSNNQSFYQITSDDGLLNAPLSMTRLMLGSGERAEILIDLSALQGSTIFLKQFGTQLPSGYPGGPAGMMGGTLGPLDNTDFNLVQLNVQAALPGGLHSIPTQLVANSVYSTAGATNYSVQIAGSPMNSMTNFTMNGLQFNPNVINMTTTLNTTMVWTVTNQSMMPHPFHIHGNYFNVLTVNGSTAPANLRGRKDVVVVPPNGGSVTLVTKYLDFADPVVPYMFHCHILSHEDTGMMLQFIVNPAVASIQESVNQSELMLFPNPTSSWLNLTLPAIEPNMTFNIWSPDGRCIDAGAISATDQKINVANLADGNYMLQVRSMNNLTTKQFIICH